MLTDSLYAKKQGLYRPFTEHDSCGVGFVTNIKGIKTHDIIRNGIKILGNMDHRGATGSDPKTGDGAGILIQVPDKFLRNRCEEIDIELPAVGDYGVGLFFITQLPEDRHQIENFF